MKKIQWQDEEEGRTTPLSANNLNLMQANIEEAIEEVKRSFSRDELRKDLFPVGYILQTINPENPSIFFGGTWEQIAKGRTLVGIDDQDTDFNVVKKTGGEKTHTLTIAEMPRHRHRGISWGGEAGGISLTGNGSGPGYKLNQWNGGTTNGDNIWTNEEGNSKPFNNLPPYFVCYIWQRKA